MAAAQVRQRHHFGETQATLGQRTLRQTCVACTSRTEEDYIPATKMKDLVRSRRTSPMKTRKSLAKNEERDDDEELGFDDDVLGAGTRMRCSVFTLFEKKMILWRRSSGGVLGDTSQVTSCAREIHVRERRVR